MCRIGLVAAIAAMVTLSAAPLADARGGGRGGGGGGRGGGGGGRGGQDRY
jgi:hypothetical protein